MANKLIKKVCPGCKKKFETYRAKACSKECRDKVRAEEEMKPTAGQPTKFKPEYCDMLIKHMSQGLSYETFAAVINVHRATLYTWEKHKIFYDAKRIGFEQCQLFWEKLGVGGTAGKIRNFSSGTWVYNMKCRFRKKWLIEKDSEDEKNATVKVAYDPDEE
jgi:transposase